MREAGFWETYLTLCSVPVASALETSAARSRLSKELLAELAARRPPAIQLFLCDCQPFHNHWRMSVSWKMVELDQTRY